MRPTRLAGLLPGGFAALFLLAVVASSWNWEHSPEPRPEAATTAGPPAALTPALHWGREPIPATAVATPAAKPTVVAARPAVPPTAEAEAVGPRPTWTGVTPRPQVAAAPPAARPAAGGRRTPATTLAVSPPLIGGAVESPAAGVAAMPRMATPTPAAAAPTAARVPAATTSVTSTDAVTAGPMPQPSVASAVPVAVPAASPSVVASAPTVTVRPTTVAVSPTAFAPKASAGAAAPSPAGGGGVPLFRPTNGSSAEQAGINVPSVLGAGTWYTAGFTGTQARVANIEGGHAWNGHESLSFIPAGNYFQGAGGAAGAAGLQAHATGVSATIAGQGATTRQQGVAFGITPANFYTGNIATSFGSNGSFSTTFNSEYQPYRDAVLTGINGVSTQVVDVINSSWGRTPSPTGYEFGDSSRFYDALLFRANTAPDASRRGVTVVFAAGNAGPGANTIGGPGSGLNTFVVGSLGGATNLTTAVPLFNDVSIFSSRGPQDAFIPNTAMSTSPGGGTVIAGARARVDISAPGENLFLPSSTTVATAYDRTQGTSFAAPTVAGGIALLADYGRATFAAGDVPNAIDTRVIKAVMMNSADKTANWSNAQALTGDTMRTTQALDFAVGSGRMNLDQTFRQYASAGSQLLAAGASNTELATTGWARGNLDRPVPANEATNDYFIAGPQTAFSELNVTLSWLANRGIIDLTAGTTNEVGFHDLRLEVWRYDPSAGNALLSKVAESDARFIANEHLSFLLPQAGNYMLRVARAGGAAGQVYSFAGDTTNTEYGLAWMNRESAVFTAGTTTNPTIVASTAGLTPNVLVAPGAGQTASLVFDTGTTNIANTLYLGATDRGAGGTATLDLQGTATLNVGSRLRVGAGGTVTVGAGTSLYAGAINVTAGGRFDFTGAGSSTVRFTELTSAGNLLAEAGHEVGLGQMFEGFSNSLISRATFAAPVQIGGAGNLTFTAQVLGNGTLTKVGTGAVTFAANTPGTVARTLDIQAGEVRLTTNRALAGGTSVTVGSGGTLRLAANSALPAGGNVTVGAGGTFDIGTFSNAAGTAVNTVALNGGTFRVPSGNGDYFLNRLTATGGTVDFGTTSDFWLHFAGAGAGITTNAAATTVTWSGSGTSRIQNDTSAALPVTVAGGTAPSGIDLDIAARVSSGGTNANYTKLGAGTLRLTNTGNTGSFDVQAGRLRVDNVAALGSGAYSLNGGTLTYGGATAATAKDLSVSAGGGAVEVSTAATALTLSGTVNQGGNALTKTGAGTLVLAGGNSGNSAATTAVNAGTLRVAADGALAFGSTVAVNAGGTLDVQANPSVNVQVNANGTLTNAGTVNGGVTVGANATARNAGTVTGDVTVQANGTFGGALNQSIGAAGNVTGNVSVAGTLRPGLAAANSAGQLNLTTGFGQSLSFSSGGVYLWDLVALSEADPGVSYDQIAVADGTALTLSPGAVTLAFATGAAPNSGDPFWQANRQWTILDVVNGTGGASTLFSGITNGGSFGAPGAFALFAGGDGDVVLTYTFNPVPEPAAVLGVAAAGVVGWVRRRRRAA
jgi:autotransporter-associated beta strand protein